METETATLGGGCFWCTEAIFKRLKGVISVMPGYAGGTIKNPFWEMVSTGNTGHAESIQIKFDPQVISYEHLLDVFFNLHDPTKTQQPGTLDAGNEYRSVIFYHDKIQKEIAEGAKQKVEAEGVYKDPIITEITPFINFYEAEDFHKNYFDNNKNALYCNLVISPKIHKLLEKYSDKVKEEYK